MAERHGILACGAYLPRSRLPREIIGEAHGWFSPSLRGKRGERAFGNWDEDAVTLAVEAARTCLDGHDRASVAAVDLASTSLPFADRCHAGLVGDALGLSSHIRVQDRGGHRRAATSALADRLDRPSGNPELLVAAEALDPVPGSLAEIETGHAAAALLLGRGEPIAELLSAASRHEDLIDRYRAAGEESDYVLEQRWLRDEGLRGFLPETIRGGLDAAGVAGEDVDWLVLPFGGREAQRLADTLEMGEARRADVLFNRIGTSGAAQPLVGLTWALESAEPGQVLVVVGFGQGADVLVFRTTDAVGARSGKVPLDNQLDAGREERSYTRYLALRGLMKMDAGLRAERDNRTAMSVFYRKREMLTGFVGGRCSACGTLQFPRAAVCVECRRGDTLEPESLAELEGRVKSFTEDWLAYTPLPPLMFGSIGFPGGASVVMEFTDTQPGTIEVGMPVRMAFRVKDFDERRNFRRYFWKPVPLTENATDE